MKSEDNALDVIVYVDKLIEKQNKAMRVLNNKINMMALTLKNLPTQDLSKLSSKTNKLESMSQRSNLSQSKFQT